MEDQGSILDKVILSKQTSEIEHFNPTEVVSNLLKSLISREEDVLNRRFGLSGKERETLEQIGVSYNVTRERIRQIESTAIKKIKNPSNFKQLMIAVESTIISVLESHGGIMSEESLLHELLNIVGNTPLNRQNTLFVISELLTNKFSKVKSNKNFRQSWRLKHAPLLLVEETIKELIKIINENKKPLQVDDLLIKFKESDFYKGNQHQLSDEVIISYLEISSQISKNPFGEYGLTEWGSIIPKRMNDKIYLVLKKHGKPLHFTDITRLINETGFDSKKAYPPTVHNELILNNQYILVGRGIYALREWGYKPGVVSDVLISILEKEKRPISKEELVNKLLEQRVVKKNTIYLALTDKSKFVRTADGLYTLNESE